MTKIMTSAGAKLKQQLLIAALAIMAVVVCANAWSAEPMPGEEQFEALRTRYAAQVERFVAAIGSGKPIEEHNRLILELWPGNTMINEFMELEARHRKSQVGLSALHVVVSEGGYGSPAADAPSSLGVKKALQILSENYIDHNDLDLMFGSLSAGTPYIQEVKALLRSAANSPHLHVRGTAICALARICQAEATLPLWLDANLKLSDGPSGNLDEMKRYALARAKFDAVNVDESRREALQLLDQVCEQYATVLATPSAPRAPALLRVAREPVDQLLKRERRPLAEIAESLRFELTHLTIGQPAPEIAVPNAFGNDLQLSDQRGKVTVLMFSFKGCGPCEAMYPANRKLIETYRGRPFAFLGVMGDNELTTVKESVEQGTITWPVWWDKGGTLGPIATRWNVKGWPKIYVLDHNGVIRHIVSFDSDLLDRAVARLMIAAEQPR